MLKINFPNHLEDKIFEIRYGTDNVSEIISYFPFSVPEKQEICKILNSESFDEFRTIFSDHVTDEEWNKTKVQIKKKFKDELFDIDDVSNS